MGLIRKTLSISTLGLVNWKSKKERLREAEAELELTRSDLEQATEKHGLIRQRLEAAERRAQEAELHALRDAKHARRLGRKETRAKVGRGRVAKATLLERVNPLVDATRESTQRFAAEHEPQLHDAVTEATRCGRKARAEASKRAKELRKRAEKAADHTADSVRDRAEQLTHR
jgi:hypothetical protein